MSRFLVVWDLDGTLVDSSRTIARSVNVTRAAFGLPPLAREDVIRHVGDGSRVLVERALFGRTGQPPAQVLPPDQPFEPVYERFMADYAGDPAGGSAPYPGVIDALSRLASAGAVQAVLTNKPHPLAGPVVASAGLAGFLRWVVGPGGAVDGHPTPAKPDPEGLLRMAAAAEVPLVRVWMVGDGLPDVRVAQAAGVRSVAILAGFTPREQLLGLGPEFAVERACDAAALILRVERRPP